MDKVEPVPLSSDWFPSPRETLHALASQSGWPRGWLVSRLLQAVADHWRLAWPFPFSDWLQKNFDWLQKNSDCLQNNSDGSKRTSVSFEKTPQYFKTHNKAVLQAIMCSGACRYDILMDKRIRLGHPLWLWGGENTRLGVQESICWWAYDLKEFYHIRIVRDILVRDFYSYSYFFVTLPAGLYKARRDPSKTSHLKINTR